MVLLFVLLLSHCSSSVVLHIVLDVLPLLSRYYSSHVTTPLTMLIIACCHSFHVATPFMLLLFTLFISDYSLCTVPPMQFLSCYSSHITLFTMFFQYCSFHTTPFASLLAHYSSRVVLHARSLYVTIHALLVVHCPSWATTITLLLMMQHLSHNHSSHTTFLKYLVFVTIFMISLLFLSHCCSFVLLG
jgi:hypothetical protein